MSEDNSSARSVGTAVADAGPGPGRVHYVEAAEAFRYSLTLLHRELAADEAERLDVPRRPSAMAVSVHGVVAGGYLASWSKTSDVIRWPLHAIAEAMGLDPIADSTGGRLAPGNGERGKATRRRVRVALEELAARGALQVVVTQRRRALYAVVQLPEPPAGWCDPTYVRGEEGSRETTPTAGEANRDGIPQPPNALPWDDPRTDDLAPLDDAPGDPLETVEPGRVIDLGLYEWSLTLKPGGSEGSQPLPVGGASASPVGEPAAPPRGSQPLPLTEKTKKNKQTDKQTRANVEPPPPSVRPSAADAEDQEPTRRGAGGIPPDPERLAGNGSNGAGVSRPDRAHVQALARAIPQVVARAHAHTPEHLAASMLGHAGEQHRNVLHALNVHLAAGAEAEVAAHLAAAAARWNGEARSLPGLVLTWLRDLPDAPRYRPEDYAHGFPLRDAMTACGLAGTYGVLRHATLAMASEALLDAGHDPARNADGFAAALAATLLPLVEPEHREDATPLERIAGTAQPAPFTLPDVSPTDDKAPPRGVTALEHVGLGYPDPRKQQQTPQRFPAGSGGVWT